MRIIPHDGKILGETRDVRFLKALGREIEVARIVSFGRCNYYCPYCRRDAQFVDHNGNVMNSVDVPHSTIYAILEESLHRGQRIRLSGGDPCMHPRDSLNIAEWAFDKGHKISLCHNGSSPAYMKRMAPYIAYAAIDLKAIDPDEYALRAGIDAHIAKKVMGHFDDVCWSILEYPDALLDIRTCVFSDTVVDDMLAMAQKVAAFGNNDRTFWTIRQYNPVSGIDWHPLCQETLNEWMEAISRQYPNLHIGCRLDWFGGIFYHWHNGHRASL